MAHVHLTHIGTDAHTLPGQRDKSAVGATLRGPSPPRVSSLFFSGKKREKWGREIFFPHLQEREGQSRVFLMFWASKQKRERGKADRILSSNSGDILDVYTGVLRARPIGSRVPQHRTINTPSHRHVLYRRSCKAKPHKAQTPQLNAYHYVETLTFEKKRKKTTHKSLLLSRK